MTFGEEGHEKYFWGNWEKEGTEEDDDGQGENGEGR